MKKYKNGYLFFSFVILASLFFVFVNNVQVEASSPNAASSNDTASSTDITSSSTNQTLIDSDNDGYSDGQEIKDGYSPFNPQKIKIKDSDMDNDGLNDYLEIQFKTDPFNPDSDGDGHKDGEEVYAGYNPLSSSTKKLIQKLSIDLKTQTLTYYVAGVALKDFKVSTGKASTPTPKGKFKIVNKIKKAWSKTHGLWMPYWMGINSNGVGIHELPIWPNGYREGASHLGIPVSHGCIRLGIGPAEYLYDRLEIGSEVTIK
jgi:hypothetical protein